MKKESKIERQKRRTRIWIIITTGVVLSLSILFIWFLIQGRVWNVREKEITGDGAWAKSEVLTIIENEIIGQSKIRALLGTDHILFWYPSREIKRLLAAHPEFQSIHIEARPILRHVSIEVTEKEVRGIWCGGKESKCYLFDKEGTIFKEAPETSGSLILKVNDESEEVLVLGERAMKGQSQIGNILESVTQIEKGGSEVVRIRVKERKLHEWELMTRDGVTMKFSTEFVPQDLERIINEMQEKIKKEKISSLDFRIPSKIYYK